MLTAALYPNVLRAQPVEDKPTKFFTKDGQECFCHPMSVNFDHKTFECQWLIFHEKVMTTKLYVRDCTMISPHALLLFGGDISVDHSKQQIVVDEWAGFEMRPQTAVLVKTLRAELDRLLMQKIEAPEVP